MHASCTVVHAYGAHSLCVTAPRPRYKNTLMKEPSAREIKPLVYVTNSPPRMRCVWASLTRIWTGWRVVRGRCQGSGLGSRTTCVRSSCGPKRGVCPADCLLCSAHGRLPAVKVRKLRWSIFRDEFISRLRQAEFDEVKKTCLAQLKGGL